MMIVKRVPVAGMIETNSYFYIDEASKHGFLIDAGAEADKLLHLIKDNGWIIEKILITHGHFDHIGAVAEISAKLGISYLAHQNSEQYLPNPGFNLSAFFGGDIVLDNAQCFADDAIITLEAAPQVALKAIHTPGHTQDAVMYYDAANGLAFVGDTVFLNSVGRTDIPGGDFEQLIQTIENKIFTLPENTVLYSGHTPPTTVKAEKTSKSIF